jgi:hypothetical protein
MIRFALGFIFLFSFFSLCDDFIFYVEFEQVRKKKMNTMHVTYRDGTLTDAM